MPDPTQVKRQHEKTLERYHNVVGTGVGQKYVRGLPTGEPAIVVFVRQKLSEQEIVQAHSADHIIPSSIDHVATDVMEVGDITLQGFNSRVRPLEPGFSCGHGDITAGTIGGFFRDRDGDVVALGNNHVMANENRAQIGDVVYQPGPTDARRSLNFRGWNHVDRLPYFGTLKDFVRIERSANEQDSAITKVHPELIKLDMVSSEYPEVGVEAAGWREPQMDLSVQKFGRTTGHTTGSILALDGTFRVRYGFGTAEIRNCIVTTPLSQGGDSGSVLFDMQMRAVGLLFAGSRQVTLHNPIGPVRRRYGLEIWDKSASQIRPNDWKLVPRDGKITEKDGTYTFVTAQNHACFLERRINDFESVQCTVNSGHASGATWGPGLAIVWPRGSVKVNIRINGRFGGYYNSDYNIDFGEVQLNTEYEARIRKADGGETIVGEVRNRDQWVKVLAVPTRALKGDPQYIRIGKTDMYGKARDFWRDGPMGSCEISNIQVSGS